ncbi:MAG: sugar nucleotide-binding protein [Lachnospiraceae bacterium]|nr:sugar nucleotide-binding protein [Lachnospiraceae bacterium]
MKRILITGLHSYVGNAVEAYLEQYNQSAGETLYQTDKISLRDGNWKNNSWEGYDCVLHVAGLAHADVSKLSEEEQKLYYEINADLTGEAVAKAAADGVGQFIYCSSVIIYGESAGVGKEKVIGKDTKPEPANFYGDSKLKGEQAAVANSGIDRTPQGAAGGFAAKRGDAGQMQVAILRLPMIYGKGSKGNFPVLVKLAEKMPVFPSVKNQRSMLYIENLAEFIRQLIELGKGGVFYPQNEEYVTTTDVVKMVAKARNKRIATWGILNPFVKLASLMPGRIGKLANKAFGSLTIDQTLSFNEISRYQVCNFEESIKRSVSE